MLFPLWVLIQCKSIAVRSWATLHKIFETGGVRALGTDY